ncbi:ABC-2 family transporter protein [Planctomycetes bacterium Pla163]|uniref:ABC-2 family transporter protein n=1 Tax=Rohdeia mirabilis TaxID=2528008 RepID=A0A518CWU6_9BACT|nr:ABC-2 family transporter protein [Planctomycetes bacterium Pla163]
MSGARNLWVVGKRELRSYFATPVAYVFLVVFLLLAGFLSQFLGQFYEGGQANLESFFSFNIWLYLFLVPAISMRLWSEERRNGTIELLMTLPITETQAVLGKYLAAWAFCGVALALTFPIWITVAYLGDPDHGTIVTGYLGSFLMSGAFLAIGSMVSACTKNQVIAFVVTATVGFVFILADFPFITGVIDAYLPEVFGQLVRSIGFMTHFSGLQRGVVELPSVVFFGSLIAAALYVNTLLVAHVKAS